MTFDGHDRQVQWNFPSPSTPGVVSPTDYEAYTYDAAGNRTSLRKRDGRTIYYGYDALNRVTLKHLAGHGNDVHYGYDLLGLQTYARFGWAGGEGVTNSYDGFGQMTSSTTTMGGTARTMTYQYDVGGNRTHVTYPDGVTVLTNYEAPGRFYFNQILGGDPLIGEYIGGGARKRRYVHGPGVDEPLVWYESAAVPPQSLRFLAANHQGSITLITDAYGSAIAVNAYDAYGIANETNLGRFQYTGQTVLPELGLYHYKARVYSPTLGRFLQTDPIGYEDQFNLYAYVGNDPVNMIDPTGEKIQLAIHDAGLGYYHAKIIIVPDDQGTFRDDPRFQTTNNGVKFLFIGGGPDTSVSVFGPLIGDLNRPKDISKTLSRESLEVGRIDPGNGDTENNLINRMIGVAKNYADNKPYSLSPSANEDDYNSNSFACGVLRAVGLKNVPIPDRASMPGAEKPLLPESFCMPGVAGCR